jgi:type II secretory pathway predicted ATPase ExeA
VYETYYGFAEKPFSLTPDPKYLFRSQPHGDAFDLLQYAIRRREGFVVVTGDIGTGKTTLCRAVLEKIDRATFTALVLNPFLNEEDLLKLILQDFGVVSRDEIKAGRLAGVTKQGLIDALYDFLLSLIPLDAGAVLIIDEAQNLPPGVLEQIRILSNLETDKEKLLQIVLVGQLSLRRLLATPEMRQLDQRVSIRYELKPLDRDAVGAYVVHRLTVAGGSGAVTFPPKTLDAVYRLSGGIPRVINLICDRALLAAYAVRVARVTPDMVRQAAQSLDVAGGQRRLGSLPAAAAVALAASTIAVSGSAYLYQLVERGETRDTMRSIVPAAAQNHPGATPSDREVPVDTAATILVGAYPADSPGADAQIRSVVDWLEAFGMRAYYSDVDLGARGRWRRVLAGSYTSVDIAARDLERLRAAAPGLDARAIDLRRAGPRSPAAPAETP